MLKILVCNQCFGPLERFECQSPLIIPGASCVLAVIYDAALLSVYDTGDEGTLYVLCTADAAGIGNRLDEA